MYTVLIAEDELLVRIGIASSVPWAEMNMRLIGEVEDGESAWNLYEAYRPDIVITDIRMPGMDGLELLKRIRGSDEHCSVIIITNVEHDETLREAEALGVTDVLHKASMKQEDIRLALEKALRNLPDAEAEETAMDESAFWRAALLDESALPGLYEPYGLVMLHVFPDDKVSHRMIHSLVELAVHDLGSEEDFCVVRTETGALFVLRKAFDEEKQARKLAELQQYVWSVFRVRVGFARLVGKCGQPRLRQICSFMRRLSTWEAFFAHAVLTIDVSGAYGNPSLQNLRSRIGSFSCLSERYPQLLDFAGALEQYPGNLTDGWESVRARGEKALTVMGVSEQCDSISVLTKRICECGEALALRIEQSLKPELLTVISYVDAHLEEELSASQVSVLIGYQPKYFSRLFKSEMGCNYSDFVTWRRIDKARELLAETTLPVQEIAEKCGFSEVSYFSSRFKQITGMTPKQVRTIL